MTDLIATIKLARTGGFTLDVELRCPPGITCIMGASGSGKSTVLSVLAGLAVPDAGRVALGDDVWLDTSKGIDLPTPRRKLAFVFQGLALFPHMTARKNVEYGMHDRPKGEREARSEKLLARVGVGHLADRKPRTFSGGEAQRVAIARALARSPQLILFDEPYSALDRDLRTQLVALERELVGELGVPIVHVTHAIGEARALGDQIIRMDKGRIVATGTATEILSNVTED